MNALSPSVLSRPSVRPLNPCFSSGPCAKRPGWTVGALSGALVGRSHRSPEGRARLNDVIVRSRRVLGVPQDWHVGIVPASDTGAMEMALWSLLGERPVDVLAFESFSACGRRTSRPSSRLKARACSRLTMAACPIWHR